MGTLSTNYKRKKFYKTIPSRVMSKLCNGWFNFLHAVLERLPADLVGKRKNEPYDIFFSDRRCISLWPQGYGWRHLVLRPQTRLRLLWKRQIRPHSRCYPGHGQRVLQQPLYWLVHIQLFNWKELGITL